MITGAKVKTDPRDAFALAKPLKAGVIPKAYIYPRRPAPSEISFAGEAISNTPLRRTLRVVPPSHGSAPCQRGA